MGGGHHHPGYSTGPGPSHSHYQPQHQQHQQQHRYAQAPPGQQTRPQQSHPPSVPSTNPHTNPKADLSPAHSSSSGQPQHKPPSAAPQDDPVDSWEQMAGDEGTNVGDKSDELPSSEQQPSKLATGAQNCVVKEPTAATTKSAEKATVQSKPTTPPSSTSSSTAQPPAATLHENGGGGGSSSSKKNPSPNLSKSSKAEGGSSKSSQSVVVPPKDKDEKENLNVIFIGHVDAGKSTIGGHIMFLTGQVDKRTLEKYEREAKEKNRETWYLSWALDTNQEERDKGKTVEVGRAAFETTKKRFTILDAPGHAGFVPNMIGGAAQADIGVLVISARKGEFETGFERKGQTREHAMLAKTAGVKHLIVLVNKMDDPTVEWLEDRFEECKVKLTPFLRKVGFNPKTDLFFIPVSGLTGANLKNSSPDCPWYKGPPFITYLDDLPPIVREDNGILRMPIADKHKDMGTLVMGKIESGAVVKNTSLLLMPNKVNVEVLQVIRVEEEVFAAYAGDNVKLRLKGVEEEDISAGFVLCDPSSPCSMGQVFDAQIVVLEYKSIICAGYTAVLHIHTVVEEVQILALKALIDRKTGKCIARNPRFVKQDQVVIATLQTNGIICLETFKDFPQMARFTLRDEGKTVAIGKVLKLLSSK